MKKKISLEDFWEYANGNRKIELSQSDIKNVSAGRRILEDLARRGGVYGSNRGVGPFFNELPGNASPAEFQRNLIRSHAVGTGDLLSREEARGVMFLLINMLRRGYSGISLATVKQLIWLFNEGIIPAIPSQGSLGASGDLAPLAHLALVLLGEGNVLSDRGPISTKYAWPFDEGIIKPIELKEGEGLALINGTHFMASLLAFAYKEAEKIARNADFIAALTLFALNANPRAFLPAVHNLRPHKGQVETAKRIASLLTFADINGFDLQDAYSLRCVPQVHGPIHQTFEFLKETLKIEINSVSGNPIFCDGEVWHGGNFHGHPLALVADFMSIALTTLSNISERRIDRILNADFLPKFLAPHSAEGNYGMMMSQYTAAALVSENKTLSHPASVDSIPTAGGQEDYVSMGAWAARKLRKVCRNTARVLAIEKECALRALELQNIKIPNPLEEALGQ